MTVIVIGGSIYFVEYMVAASPETMNTTSMVTGAIAGFFFVLAVIAKIWE